ncbi:MAG: hypothetical protein H6662_15160 [Ardenticatenaceae bacterium]|nr:hypothetical protein [Anaerolineales bacterium]MCB8922926.1 hypothetical protein [Ardenticatenaceae bacterium]MCB8990338.1 hypothetical protein [Ardenticatenaceae bacterium]MCB9005231.1 hypothetical protein [Ardenticatenaceae bacterium]
MVRFGLERTQQRLREFEQEFGMTSAEFLQRLLAAEIEETIAFTDWRMEIGMLSLLESQYQALQDVQLD